MYSTSLQLYNKVFLTFVADPRYEFQTNWHLDPRQEQLNFLRGCGMKCAQKLSHFNFGRNRHNAEYGENEE